MIGPSTDLTPAAWVTESCRTEPWGRLVAMGPSGYEAYARLRFLPDPTAAGQEEGDVDPDVEDPRHEEPGALFRACATLAPFTATPDALHVALWEGWGLELELPRFHLHSPDVRGAMRSYWLFTAGSSDLSGWPHEPPAMVWPDDRAWFVAYDVDPHYAGVAGSREAIVALLADPSVDAVGADLLAEQPGYGRIS
ncbi:MAG: hypothetical protein Q7T56_04395 [Nocardioidaceae bacterium]|nr:hypothetical protein [Nocardioidaceae bacterium]